MLLLRSYEAAQQYDEALELLREKMPALGLPDRSVDHLVSKVLYDRGGVEGVVMDPTLTNMSLKRVYLASLCDDQKQQGWLGNAPDGDTTHAIFVDLALRYLFAGDFAALHRLMEANSDSVVREFSAIRTAVRQIASGESLGKAYMNIAYFMQAISGAIYPPDRLEDYLVQPHNQQCRQNTGRSRVKGPYFYFNQSLEYFSDTDRTVDEQKSLFYLTMCFKQGSSSQSCLWGVKPENGLSSKEAFDRLHGRYPDSEWAFKAKYYYQ